MKPGSIELPATVEERADVLVTSAELLAGGVPSDAAHLLAVAVMKLAFAQENAAAALGATIDHLQRALTMATAAVPRDTLS